MKKQINLWSQNSCLGLFNKISQIHFLIDSEPKNARPDIFFLQETEINQATTAKDFEIPGYIIHFKQPKNNKTRVAVYTAEDLQCEVDCNFKHPLIQVETDRAIFFGIYRPFKKEKNENYEQLMQEIVEELSSKIEKVNRKDIYIIGDLNLDYAKINQKQYNQSKIYELWQFFYESNNLTQHVKTYTWERTIKGKQKTSTLDHFYSTAGKPISIKTERTQLSDHKTIKVEIQEETQRIPKRGIFNRSLRNYSQAMLVEKLSTQMGPEEKMSIEGHSNYLQHVLMKTLDEISPERYVKKKLIPFMWDDKLMDLKRKRDNAYKKAKKTSNETKLEETRKLDRQIRKLVKKSYKREFRRKSLKNERFDLWKSVRLATGETKTTEKELKMENIQTYLAEEKPELLMRTFDRKITDIEKCSKIDRSVFNGYRLIDYPNETPFSDENLEMSIKQMKRKGSFGHDRIPMFLLKDGWMAIKNSIKTLFQKIEKENIVPEIWKIGRIIPLHKKGPKNDTSNYRPITNLCSIAKLFERCINLQLEKIATTTGIDITGENQYAFKKGSSTTLAAMNLKRNIVNGTENNKWVGVISLDLSSAFDAVNHELLFKRLEILGIPSNLLKLIEQWLTNRTQYVEYDDQCSTSHKIRTGTVQGSVLGPVLFSLFVQPLLQQEDIIIYADDTYIDEEDENIDNLLKKLEIKSTRIATWLIQSGMKINLEKTEFCLFHRSKQVTKSITIRDQIITSNQSIKVLGIIFDSKLDWHKQIEHTSKKTKQNLFGLLKLKRFLNEEEMVLVAKSCCLSTLYYGAQVFLHPNLRKDLFRKLMSVSTQIIKTCYNLYDWSLIKHEEIHQLAAIATPKMFANYTQAMSLFDLSNNNSERTKIARENISKNEIKENRLRKLHFTTSNKSLAGRQLIENSLSEISNKIPFNWRELSRYQYKTLMKKEFLEWK